MASANGRIDEQVDRTVGWFMDLGHFDSYRNLVRQDRHLLPRRAIREALANAVTDRDYAITGSQVLLEVFERRVDVTSPGALPNHRTVEHVRAGANPRSRHESIAHYMAAMGFMEQRGRGWMIMRSEMRGFDGRNRAGADARRTKQVCTGDVSPGVRRRRETALVNERAQAAGADVATVASNGESSRPGSPASRADQFIHEAVGLRRGCADVPRF